VNQPLNLPIHNYNANKTKRRRHRHRGEGGGHTAWEQTREGAVITLICWK
jgi:hypothetical protein